MGIEVLSQAVTSIRPFMAPSINWLNFAEKGLFPRVFALLAPSGRRFSGSNGQGLPP